MSTKASQEPGMVSDRAALEGIEDTPKPTDPALDGEQPVVVPMSEEYEVED